MCFIFCDDFTHTSQWPATDIRHLMPSIKERSLSKVNFLFYRKFYEDSLISVVISTRWRHNLFSEVVAGMNHPPNRVMSISFQKRHFVHVIQTFEASIVVILTKMGKKISFVQFRPTNRQSQ